MLERPLQWAICFLHCNERPLRYVFQNIDEAPKGLDTFPGEIGRTLNGKVKSVRLACSKFQANKKPSIS